MVSSFSWIMTLVVFSVFMLVIAAFIRRTGFLVRYGTLSLFVLVVLGIIRLCLPWDMEGAWIIRSHSIVPRILAFLDSEIVFRWTVGMLLMLAWAAGSLFMLARAGNRFIREQRRRKRYRQASNTQALHVLSKLDESASIMVSPDVNIPHMIGITKAHIYLPDINYTDSELTWVLRHELQHFKSKDTLTKLFYLLLTIVFWWNPIVHWFQSKLDTLLEIKCDSQLTHRLTERERLAYLEVILKTLTASRKPVPSEQVVSAFIKDNPDFLIKQRFELVLKAPVKRKSLHQTLAIGVAVVMFLASFFVIIQPAYSAPTVEEGPEFIALSPQNAYIVVKGEVYTIYVDGAFWGTATAEIAEEHFSFLNIYYETE